MVRKGRVREMEISAGRVCCKVEKMLLIGQYVLRLTHHMLILFYDKPCGLRFSVIEILILALYNPCFPFQGEFPVIWTLSDKETDEPILCFKFKINIV